jgi:fibronectin-binding autotransporter adhesin
MGDGSNSGTVALTNVNNSYTGGTIVSGATLSVANDGNLGEVGGGLTLDGGELAVAGGFVSSRSIALTASGGTLAVVTAGAAEFQGDITGPGDLTVGDTVNTGVVGLSGNNTYLGSTNIVNGAALQALSVTALSPVSVFIVDGTLDLNGFSNQIGELAGGGTVTNGGYITTAVLTVGDISNSFFNGVLKDGNTPLGLTKVGAGVLNLRGSSTYSGPTTISEGKVQAESTTAFSPNSAFTVNGVLELFGFSNTIGSLAGSGTVTDGGALNNNLGPLVNPIVGPAVLTAGRDGTSTVFSGSLVDGVGGSLGFVKTGGGTLTLTGTNTYKGGTTVTAGILQIGNGPTVGSIRGDVTDNGALVFDRNASVTFGGVVSGTGNLSQVGSGTLILKGTSTYTGTTTVAAGTLQVAGGLGNTAVTVLNGATLAGQGIIEEDVTIQDGAVLAPGPGVETLDAV